MPYSPIRLQQINTTQLSGYILDVVDGQFVLLTGDQNISGFKSFYDGVEIYDGSGNKVFASDEKALIGNWQMNGQTIGLSGIVNLSFLQTGDFNLLNVVRTTGNQNISGAKTYFNRAIFRSGVLVSGDFEYSGTPISQYGVVNLGFLQSGNFALPNVVRTTGNQTIEGLKTFSDIYTLGQKIKRTVINSSTYSVTYNDFYLAVNSSGSSKTLSFPIPSGDAKVFKVKDIAGQSTGNNIILSGSGVTFDYSPTFTISDAYASVDVIAGSGNNYEVL
jgi:Lower baseplate protein N-terminal domain